MPPSCPNPTGTWWDTDSWISTPLRSCGHPTTRDHDPQHEVWVGVATDGTEVAARVDVILEALRAAWTPGRRGALPHPDDVLARVHDPELLDFLATAADRWREGPYADLVGQDRVVPYLFPTPAMTGGLPARPAVAVHADAGRFAYDTMTLVGPGTWPAARAAADCALTAADLVAAGEPAGLRAVPPSRAPRDAGRVRRLLLPEQRGRRGRGPSRTRVRAGSRHRRRRPPGQRHGGDLLRPGDVLYGSVHVDPAAGWFPHVVGPRRRDRHRCGGGGDQEHPARRGHRRRRAGSRRCRTSPSGPRLRAARALVVSLGVDAAKDDPESPLLVTADGYRGAGALLGGTGLPAVVVQEGGYHLPTLGGLVAAYLEGHAARRRLMFFCRHLAKPCRCRGSIRAWRTCCPAGPRRPPSPGS